MGTPTEVPVPKKVKVRDPVIALLRRNETPLLWYDKPGRPSGDAFQAAALALAPPKPIRDRAGRCAAVSGSASLGVL
jgi:hypothetical protein